MRKIDGELIRRAEDYVSNLLENKLSAEYLFHNIRHTLNVTKGAIKIGLQCGLDEDQLKVLQMSAVFHDVGYITTNDNHEAESAFIASEFLRSGQVEEEQIGSVVRAILATKVPQEPGDAVSEVLCDADLMHLTLDDYFDQMELLRLEWQVTGRYFYTVKEFHQNSIRFFERHHYHSSYGRTVMEGQKANTLRMIREKLEND